MPAGAEWRGSVVGEIAQVGWNAQSSLRDALFLKGLIGAPRAVVERVKHWTRVIDWAVVTALSLLIVAALVHAGGQLRAAGTQTQTTSAQSRP
jgi:hypothetical protein